MRCNASCLADTLYIVTPGIFMRYAQEFRWEQKRFERLKLYKKQLNGFNIWACTGLGLRRTRVVRSCLLLNSADILPEVPFNNPYLALSDDAKRQHLKYKR
jgi:hypothetical protein